MYIHEPQFRYFNHFLDARYYKDLESYVLSNDVKWSWMEQTVNQDYEDHIVQDSFMLGHSVFKETEQQTSVIPEIWQPLAEAIENQFLSRIHRIRLNLYTNQNKKLFTILHNDIHEGSIVGAPDRRAEVIILNFTNCNGGTKIGNIEIQSRRNGAVLFNNVHKHCGILHTDVSRRVCANIVIYPQKTSNSDSIA